MFKNLPIYILLLFFIIFSSVINSQITYFYSDNIFVKYIHEISLDKNIFEVLLQKYSINGISVIPLSPSLNPLSFLNYQISTDIGYILYLIIFRVFEFITILFVINSFFKEKISIYLKTLVFISLVFYFNIFDHQSYINFPILVFNLTIAIAYKFRNKIFFYLSIFFLGNLWSFLINPTYFLTTCFVPLLFYYFFLFLNKNYKILAITFIINLPFLIIYSFLMLGTARFFFGGEIINEQSNIYNFSFFNSYATFILILLSAGFIIFNKGLLNPFIKSFIIIQILFLILGLIFKYNLINWFLPHPAYLEYSFQYIFLSAIIFISFGIKKNFKILIIIFLFLIIINQLYKNFYKFINHKELIIKNNYLMNSRLLPKYFWENNEIIFLNKKYKNRIFYIYMPNASSNFAKYLLNQESQSIIAETMMLYIENFGHSLTWNEFFKANVVVNIGHSLLLDISTTAANLRNYNDKKNKNIIPVDRLDSKINEIYDIEYVLSDVKLDFEIEEVVNFKNFELFIYKYPKIKNKEFKNIIKISDFKNFYLDKNKTMDNFYVEEEILKTIDITKYKCNLMRNPSNQYLQFSITSDKFPCLAVFPISFSKTNQFFDTENKELKTFRGQYFFHSYIFKNENEILVKKKSIFLYAFNSLLDFIENKRIYNNSKN